VESVLSVLLVVRNDAERAQLRAAFEALPGVAISGERADLRSGLALAQQVNPSVLVLELSSAVDDVLSAAAQFRLQSPDVAVFLVSDAFDPDTLLRAMRAGVHEILRRPLDRGALGAAVERVAALRSRQNGSGSAPRVFTVFSSKGGSGVSTVAANFAIGLRRATGREVALADFDRQSGDAAFLLGLTPNRSIADLLGGRIDSAAVQDVLAKHDSGLYLLSQPEDLDRIDEIEPVQVGSILEILTHTFEMVVVDAPHILDATTLEILDRSSMILLVVEQTVASVRGARRTLDVLQRLNYVVGSDRMRLVLNRHAGNAEITPAQIEETLGMPVFAKIANDHAAVTRSIDTGKALCDHAPDSRAARDLTALARQLSGNAASSAAPAEVPTARAAKPWIFGRRKAS